MVTASPDEALFIDVPPGAPLLAITRTTTDTNGKPLEFSHDLFRGDRTRIAVEVVPSADGVVAAAAALASY